MLFYTDGACEAKITAGALLFDPEDQSVKLWGIVVPKTFSDEWLRVGVKHAVAQCETFPVLVSLTTWPEELRDREVLHFVDNNQSGNRLSPETLGQLLVYPCWVKCIVELCRS